MRRPLFLFFIGLVLGEAAAIFLNRIGFFVMALFLLIFMIFCFIFYRKVRREQSLFFIYEVLCWFFFLMGGIAFFRASYFNEIDRILSKKTLTGTLIGQVEYVRQNAEGEYQITVRENSFVVNENHLKDGIKKNLKKCSISSIKSNLRQTKKLPGKCRLVKIPLFCRYPLSVFWRKSYKKERKPVVFASNSRERQRKDRCDIQTYPI